jgi:hypothetical protein
MIGLQLDASVDVDALISHAITGNTRALTIRMARPGNRLEVLPNRAVRSAEEKRGRISWAGL